jgi:hypothetical protein
MRPQTKGQEELSRRLALLGAGCEVWRTSEHLGAGCEMWRALHAWARLNAAWRTSTHRGAANAP